MPALPAMLGSAELRATNGDGGCAFNVRHLTSALARRIAAESVAHRMDDSQEPERDQSGDRHAGEVGAEGYRVARK
jgi:hypothetical protein